MQDCSMRQRVRDTQSMLLPPLLQRPETDVYSKSSQKPGPETDRDTKNQNLEHFHNSPIAGHIDRRNRGQGCYPYCNICFGLPVRRSLALPDFDSRNNQNRIK